MGSFLLVCFGGIAGFWLPALLALPTGGRSQLFISVCCEFSYVHAHLPNPGRIFLCGTVLCCYLSPTAGRLSLARSTCPPTSCLVPADCYWQLLTAHYWPPTTDRVPLESGECVTPPPQSFPSRGAGGRGGRRASAICDDRCLRPPPPPPHTGRLCVPDVQHLQ